MLDTYIPDGALTKEAEERPIATLTDLLIRPAMVQSITAAGLDRSEQRLGARRGMSVVA